jgi:hypothetical protein
VCIRDSGTNKIVKGDNEELFQYKKVRERGASAVHTANSPYWFIPSLEIPPSIPGINMATSVEVGFFGPTNNVAGAQWHNFLADPMENIERPAFKSIDPTRLLKDDGHLSSIAEETIGIISQHNPSTFST